MTDLEEREKLLDAIEMAATKLEHRRLLEREARHYRDALIRAARIRGITLREIGTAANLTKMAVRKAAGEGGER